MLTKFSERHPIITGVIVFAIATALPDMVIAVSMLISWLFDFLLKTHDSVGMLMFILGLFVIFAAAFKFHQLVCFNVMSRMLRLLPLLAVLCGYVSSIVMWIDALRYKGHGNRGRGLLSIGNIILYTVELAGFILSRSVYRSVIARLPISTTESAEDTIGEESQC